MSQLSTMDGRVCLVIGGTSGIGRAMCRPWPARITQEYERLTRVAPLTFEEFARDHWEAFR